MDTELYECLVCSTAKPRSEYYSNFNRQTGKSYRRRQCKTCVSTERRVYYNSVDKENISNRAREWVAKHRYGLTKQEADALWNAENCAICGATEPDTKGKKKRFCIDHCHVTGTVRGALCQPCNAGLGLFKDSADTLRKAAAYLDRAGE